MTVSIRSYLTAGAATMVVGAMAIAPVQPSAPASITADTVRLSAAIQPLVNQVNSAGVTLGQSAPAAVVQQPQAQKSAQANNNVSDAINNAYSVIMYWANYWANELGPYLLGWVPFGYLIADQISIWFNTFTVPVSASFVYDFLDPVVNDFWNPTVWRDGLTALANTTFASLGQTINAEVYYIVSLQWFPIPLPPLPPWPFAATKVPAGAASAAAATEKTATTKSSGTGHSARPQAAKQDPEPTDTTDVTDGSDATVVAAAAGTPSASKTTKADSSKSSSGKSGATKSGDTGKKSTGGSARSHGPKADKGGD